MSVVFEIDSFLILHRKKALNMRRSCESLHVHVNKHSYHRGKVMAVPYNNMFYYILTKMLFIYLPTTSLFSITLIHCLLSFTTQDATGAEWRPAQHFAANSGSYGVLRSRIYHWTPSIGIRATEDSCGTEQHDGQVHKVRPIL